MFFIRLFTNKYTYFVIVFIILLSTIGILNLRIKYKNNKIKELSNIICEYSNKIIYKETIFTNTQFIISNHFISSTDKINNTVDFILNDDIINTINLIHSNFIQ